MNDSASAGFTGRALPRCIRRAHHTVLRWLERERVRDLAYELAAARHYEGARAVAADIGVDFATEIRTTIDYLRTWYACEAERISSLAAGLVVKSKTGC